MPIFLLRFAAVAVRIGAGIGARLGARAAVRGGDRRGGATPRIRPPQVKTSFSVRWHDGPFLRAVDDACRRALEEAAQEVASRAQARAPVRTGRLRASITVGSVYETSDGYAIDIAATAPYAVYVQEGTEDTSAQPFLERSLRGATAAIRRELADGIPG